MVLWSLVSGLIPPEGYGSFILVGIWYELSVLSGINGSVVKNGDLYEEMQRRSGLSLLFD